MVGGGGGGVEGVCMDRLDFTTFMANLLAVNTFSKCCSSYCL